jgi:ATP-dependent DNA helicase RecQ
LTDMDNYARGAVCRHKALVGYFGQSYAEPSCSACDLCLGDVEVVADGDSLVIAQKILSCVARVKERFGVNHVIGVLRADDSERIRQLGHDKLSTFGLLKEHSVKVLRDWIFQLIGQGVLAKSGDEYPVLKLNLASWEVMKGKQKVQLVQPVRKKSEKVKQSRADVVSWDGVERNLFETLRKWRFDLAKQSGKPPYVIMSDETLRQLARVRPSDSERLRLIYGIGDQKLRTYGHLVLSIVKEYCEEHGLAMDNEAGPVAAAAPAPAKTITPVLAQAFQLFREGAAIEDVMHQTGRARATVADYLYEFIRQEKPASVAVWVGADVYARVAEAVGKHGSAKLKPLFIALEEKVSYDEIRVVVAHLNKDQG